jgi:alpha-mannosidase
VHQEAEATYARVSHDLQGIIATAMAALSSVDADAWAAAPWVYNAAPGERAAVVTVPAGLADDMVDDLTDGQRLSTGDLAVYAEVPAMGVASLRDGTTHRPADVVVTGHVVDNGLIRIEFDDNGLLTSVRDLVADREVLADGRPGNLLQMHADLPNEWDAWDIDAHYRRQRTDLIAADSVTVVESGPLVGAVRVERAFSSSHIVQTIRVRAGSRRIDIETDIDWHESEKILKAAFPIDVHADRSAAEIQFGHVYRPTHTNTSWDAARFEVYAHRWVHVAEPGYGVAVLNDSTYGHDISRHAGEDGRTTTTVRLSLVRAPRCPDPHADQGRHRFTYALLPGASIKAAVAEGYALNLPLRVEAGRHDAVPAPLVTVDDPGVVVEAVKLADDRTGDVIVRIYEALGGRAATTVRAGFAVAASSVVDLLERPVASPSTVESDGGVRVELRPFQIVTLRLARH